MAIRHRMVRWTGAAAASICGAAIVAFWSPAARATGTSNGQASAGITPEKTCHATGNTCFLGIDPDIYQMPLVGEYIQHRDRLICATRNWSEYPPETFDIDFMRALWPQLAPTDQAATEAAALFFVTMHWGPPCLFATCATCLIIRPLVGLLHGYS